MSSDTRTTGIVLRRTNYGEADRILNILTPVGKFSVIARGVRRPRSKLAGGIEMFCLSDIVVHQGKGDLAILTSSKMLACYTNLLTDLTRLEIASRILKTINRITDQVATNEHFNLLKQTLEGLNSGLHPAVVETWFNLNFRKLCGEELNFRTDTTGAKLQPDLLYIWDHAENALRPDPRGNIGTSDIKLARLMMSSSLKLVAKVNGVQDYAIIGLWQN